MNIALNTVQPSAQQHGQHTGLGELRRALSEMLLRTIMTTRLGRRPHCRVSSTDPLAVQSADGGATAAAVAPPWLRQRGCEPVAATQDGRQGISSARHQSSAGNRSSRLRLK